MLEGYENGNQNKIKTIEGAKTIDENDLALSIWSAMKLHSV